MSASVLSETQRHGEHPRLLVVDTLDPRSMLHSLVSGMDSAFEVDECYELDCEQKLRTLQGAVFVVNAFRKDAVEIAVRLNREKRGYVVIVANDQSRLDYSQLATAGNEWSVARRDPNDLARALALALRVHAQRRRFRTKLHQSLLSP